MKLKPRNSWLYTYCKVRGIEHLGTGVDVLLSRTSSELNDRSTNMVSARKIGYGDQFLGTNCGGS